MGLGPTTTDDRGGSLVSKPKKQWVIPGTPVILGALDRSLTMKVIDQNLGRLKYCYQREVTNNPSLKGKITVKFVVAKDGTVSKANIESSSMRNPKVEDCLTKAFMRFTFPKPKGGGMVIVSYPFAFQPG